MASNTIPITVIGNLTADPEVRTTPSGATVANISVASTPQVYNREEGEYRDGETTFLRGSVWRQQADNVGESLHKGDRVIVTGELVTRSWETDDGEKRSVHEVQINEIGPSLLFATVEVSRRGGGGGEKKAPAKAKAAAKGGDDADKGREKVGAGAGSAKGDDLF